MKEHKYKNAIESYKNALRNDPKDNQVRYNLALAKKLNEQEERDSKDDQNKLKPSEFAKKEKQSADKKAETGDFSNAYKIMEEALQKDSTVSYFDDYIKKLKELIILDTIE